MNNKSTTVGGINQDFPETAGVDPKSIYGFSGRLPDDWHSSFNMLSPMESCLFKSGMSVIGGGVMGLAFGIFGSFDTSYLHDEKLAKASTKVQLKHSLKQMGTRGKSMAKNFAFIGGLYSGVECGIEKYRGKHDISNTLIAGCVTGGGLAIRQGPIPTVLGCGSFAAFSYVIEKLLLDR